ncbi:hypothetical protein BRD00_12685 [Halobacteriales archaeon QS_8_69_26]|nr:MAG: hypothetical protein BRD00_12685 [Halobacteriales archaeon QS_8_69_26]
MRRGFIGGVERGTTARRRHRFSEAPLGVKTLAFLVGLDGVVAIITGMGIGIDGWAFFRTTEVGVRDAPPVDRVVRDDGTVVTGDPGEELERIYRSIDVLDRDPPPSRKMARAAAALLAPEEALVAEENVKRWTRRFPDRSLAPPEVRRTDEGLVLTFWTRTTGRGVYATEWRVTATGDYDVRWERITD